jgi:hypothetical protein
MRKLMLAIFGLMLLVAPALAQQPILLQPDCVIPFSFTAAGQTTPVAGGVGDFRYTACTKWTLRYYNRGFSAVSIEFQHADDNGNTPGSWNTWGTSGGTLASGSSLPLTVTTSGQATGYKYRPWVRVKLNSATGTGVVEGVLEGWRPFGGSDDGNGGGSTTNVTQWAAGTLGAMANYGTSPGAVLVPGVNASVTNIPHVIADTGSTTAVTGNVTAVQPTGSNLHAVLDANSGVDIGKLTANQSVNVAQINGVTPLMGTGIMGTGSPRVTIASDNDPVTVKQATASNFNADVNVKNINGIVPLMGNGITGTGSLRVTIASDNTAFTVNAAQSGTWTVQPGNTANTTPWLVTARIVGNAGGIVDFAGQNAASPASALLHGCQFNTTPTTISSGNSSPCQLDPVGNLRVNTEGSKTTYSASATNFTPAATPSDVCVMPGSATKTVRVTRIMVQGFATTKGSMNLAIIKRTTADSAGTSAALTVIPYDSSDAAGTAAPLKYTANPTVNSTVGTYDVKSLNFAVAGDESVPYVFDTGYRGGAKALVLRGTAQQIAVNFGGGTVPTGGTVGCSFEWTEE